jgi:hypothetical protein
VPSFSEGGTPREDRLWPRNVFTEAVFSKPYDGKLRFQVAAPPARIRLPVFRRLTAASIHYSASNCATLSPTSVVGAKKLRPEASKRPCKVVHHPDSVIRSVSFKARA